MDAIIETIKLRYRYPDGTQGLNGLDTSIKKGSTVAFVGPNGSGKSTLFLHLNGILKPLEGAVRIEGKPLRYNRRSLKEVRQKIGMVFQDPDDQLFAPTVYQDVAFGPRNLGLPDEGVEKRVDGILKILGISHLRDSAPHNLSQGQKRRVAIAGVLAMEPEVIVLDEPTANLDPPGVDDLMDVLELLKKENGITLITSSHSVDEVAREADRVFLINHGKTVTGGPPDEILRDRELLKNNGLISRRGG